MDRRSFLLGSKEQKTSVSAKEIKTSARTNSGVQPYTDAWTKNEVIHLLRRTMFGASPADVNYFLTKTVSQIGRAHV